VTGRRRLLVTVHVLGAVSNLGVTGVLFILVGRTFSSDPAVAGAAARLGSLCFDAAALPLALTALLTGIASALASPWRLFRHGWVVKKLGLTLANLVVVAAVVGPWIGVTADSAQARLTTVGGLAGQALLLILSTALSVYKPRRKAVVAGVRQVRMSP